MKEVVRIVHERLAKLKADHEEHLAGLVRQREYLAHQEKHAEDQAALIASLEAALPFLEDIPADTGSFYKRPEAVA